MANIFCKQNLLLSNTLHVRHTVQSIFKNIQKRNVQFTPQHEALRLTARKIIERDINPNVDEWELKEDFPSHKLFKILGDAGLLGITREIEYGGSGLDYSFSFAFFEELATIRCGGIPTAITVHTDMTLPALANFGSDKLKREFLVPTVKGDFVSCVAITEPSGGSDVSAIKTTARSSRGDNDGDLIINGSKQWITNGCHSDWICLLANTSQGKPHNNKSLICVPKTAKGITATPIQKMGLRCSDTATIFFDDVKVPKSNIIGDAGNGFTYVMLQFIDERLCASIVAVKQMDRMINETIAYCKARETFGKPLIENQVIQFRLAEMKSEIELLNSLNHRIADIVIAGESIDHGVSSAMLAAVAKLKAGKLIRKVSSKCLQMFGASGYGRQLLVERAYRDARVLSIAGGADEIMLGIVAKFMGILKKPSKS